MSLRCAQTALLLALLSPVGIIAQDAPRAPGGVIRGTVKDADTGKPIANATICVAGVSTTSSYSACGTAGNGSYALKRLPPGRYKVSSWMNGYLRPDEAGVEVVVWASANTQVDFVLQRPGVINARIIDESGRPARNYRVRPFQLSPVPPVVSRFVPAGRTNIDGTTNERGKTVLYLPPGEYYVAAEPSIPTNATGAARHIGEQSFYPGADEAGAQAVIIKPGKKVSIEIRIKRSAVK